MDCHDIEYCGKKVGTIIVEQEGLYIRFKGQLTLPVGPLYRICAVFKDISTDLGVPFMEGNRFCINAKIARRKIGDGPPRFYVSTPEKQNTVFCEISENNAFEYIAMLPNAIFHRRAEKRGICIAKDQGETMSAVTVSQ